MAELLEVVADAVRRVGGDAESFEGLVPPDPSDTVFVVVPHEYFAVLPRELHPEVAARQSMIGLCVEHPGTGTFETVAEWSRGLGAVIATSAEAVAELTRRGIRSERFVLGYSPLWDRWHGHDAERTVDVTYMGTLDARRTPIVTGWADSLWQWRTRLLMPPHEPMTRTRPDFLRREEKWDHLAASKVLLNLHREGAYALEWVRVLEAICNGCVVITERSLECAPLVPGTHVLMGRPGTLGLLASTLLRHPDRLASIQAAAYKVCRQELDMAPSATRLLDVAGRLQGSRRARRTGPHPVVSDPVVWAPPAPPMDERIPLAAPHPPGGLGASDPIHRSVWQLLRQDLLARRTMEDTVTTEWHPVVETAAVTVLVIEQAGGPGKTQCVKSLAGQTGGLVLGLRTVVDGVDPERITTPTPVAGQYAGSFGGGWLEIRHETPLGTGYSLNEALATVQAPLTLVLEAGMRLFPPTVQRLAAVIAQTGAPAVSALGRSSGVALWNALPPEPRRLARYPYLGSGFLIATDVLRQLGGFAEDPGLEGLELHDFWCRFAASGLSAVLLREVLIDRQAPTASASRPVDVDPWSSWQALRRRSPSLPWE
ncbi:MAG TPA: glycosyltransferase [Candidatus Dormibacteraeota bacterium]|nr:glycosyltransferase [Candidatus Dormibacteraeota bacterium]